MFFKSFQILKLFIILKILFSYKYPCKILVLFFTLFLKLQNTSTFLCKLSQLPSQILNLDVQMSSSSSPSSSIIMSSSSAQQAERYVTPERTTLIPVDSLEVVAELMVDFDNLKENGFDLLPAVEFQGWKNFFDRLVGPVFPHLVKEFWIHAIASPKVILSFVMGKEISITENLIRKLLGFEGHGVTGISSGRMDMSKVYAEIFISGQASNKVRDLKSYYKIWARIIHGCIHHRKETSSPDYINADQQYLLFCLGTNVKTDLPYLLFNHLWTHVKETREAERVRNPK